MAKTLHQSSWGLAVTWRWKRQTTPQKEQELRARTERVAYLVYQNRLLTGKPGDENSDWKTAEEIIQTARSRSPITYWKSFLHWANTPREKAVEPSNKRILRRFADWWETTPVEKTLEDIEHILSNSALLSLLGLIGNVGIIIAVVTYVGTEKQRRDAEILNAWQTITNAAGEPGNAGRIRALEFLNVSPGANWRRKFPWFCAPHPLCLWPAESLAGINLSVNSQEDSDNTRVFLENIELPGADLSSANLEGANLDHVNLERANLRYANLQRAYLGRAHLAGVDLEAANLAGVEMWFADLAGAYLRYANLAGINLTRSNLAGVDMEFVDLAGANLVGANLEEADLMEANLEEAHLLEANLAGANLVRANLAGANLTRANLEEANLKYANLKGSQDLTEEQLTQAKLCATILPEHITLNPDRDCD